MAETIGLAASLAGLVTAGLAVCKGLTEYYKTYKSAEKDIQFLCEEVDNLTRILQVGTYSGRHRAFSLTSMIEP